MRNLSIIAVAAVGWAVVFSPATCAQPQTEIVEMTIHPMKPGPVALRHRLLPTFLDQIPGNGAPSYMKCFLMMNEPDFAMPRESWAMVGKWQTASIDGFPRQDVRKLLTKLNDVLQEVEVASRHEYCAWELPIRESDNPFQYRLPEVHHARSIGRILAIKARLQIAEKDYDQAIATIRIGCTLARDLAKQPTLVSGLVGIAIEHYMAQQLEAFVQGEGAPNLYWALTKVPAPPVRLTAGFQLEEVILYLVFPALRDVRTVDYTDEQWDRLASTLFQKASTFGNLVGEPEEAKWFETLRRKTLIEDEFPGAKRRLLVRGFTEGQIHLMPQSRVVLLDLAETYDEVRDDVYRWYPLPYWQGRDGVQRAEAAMKANRDRSVAHHLTSLIVPAATASRSAELRGEAVIAALRCVEAIRAHAASNDGELPADLPAIAEMPIAANPFSGEPFPYRLDGEVAVLDVSIPNVAREFHIRLGD